MSILKKSAAILSYLFIISILADFEILKLFDWKQIMITLVGAYLLYVPTNGFMIRNNLDLLGYCALIASYIQTFVILFFQLSTVQYKDFPIKDIALNCRPLLYGFFLWVVLQNRDFNKRRENSDSEGSLTQELSIESMGIILKDLGLTNREVEVAIQISKGYSNAEIAFELCISEATVKNIYLIFLRSYRLQKENR